MIKKVFEEHDDWLSGPLPAVDMSPAEALAYLKKCWLKPDDDVHAASATHVELVAQITGGAVSINLSGPREEMAPLVKATRIFFVRTLHKWIHRRVRWWLLRRRPVRSIQRFVWSAQRRLRHRYI
jgi:hypothetical protein